MIVSRLSSLMGEKRLRVADVARELGVHRNTINLLYQDTAVKIDLEVLDKLCNLFECTPNDILEYTPNDKKED